ncbi:putative vitellogenin receptor isoform X1 [Drosophila sechellia]|uniref:GM17661 n=1 Tax=Drosophila sechellia TaxID=7238 RepID=B4IGA9_DROSE|nr:putative vitellogenin receptor isoform X1 [Drosophila sechellia]EDW48843.1 GM17661 [Drosophila sechellia]
MCQAEHQVPTSEQRIRVKSPKMTASQRGFNLTSQTRAHPASGGSTSSGYGYWQRTHLIINGRHVAISLLLLLGLCGGTAAGTPGSADTRCDAGQFQCRGGGCILQAKMCDGRGDCKDSSDELDCDYRLCQPPHWFPCAQPHGACLAAELMCNGIDNCPGGEDELNCPVRPGFRFGDTAHRMRNCSKYEFTCQQDRTCIPIDFMCDGRPDCTDKSDEVAGCKQAEVTCPGEGHLCANGRCLRRKQWVCDGVDDCGDGSDERGCSNLCEPQKGKFLCRNRETCLTLSEVCDGHSDCSDGSDETDLCHSKPDCDAKKCALGAKCHMMPAGGAECFCPKGFRLAKFEDKCEDIDECKEQDDLCSQGCENTSGGYRCVCDAGYLLDKDNRTCRAVVHGSKEQQPLLLYTTQMTIMGMHLREDNVRNHVYQVAGNLSKVIGVAYDGSHIYWTNIQNEAESIVKANGDGSHAEILLTSGLDAPEDLAVDWLTQNIYFSDNIMRHIAVCSNDGLNCAVLVTQDVHQPRSLAVWPQKGLMFWTDWGEKPMIGRASMDGSRSRPIVSDNIEWPNGIALDMHQERIYWVDAKLGSVQTVRPDGTGRRTVLDGMLKHPYGLAIFEDQLYWSDWATKSVHACHKFSGKDHRILAKDRTIYAVHIYHPAKQPISPHGCENAKCSHLCLLAEPEIGGHSCACPDGMRLAPDLRRCMLMEKRQRLFIGLGQVLLEIEHTAFGRHQIRKSYTLPCLINEMVYNRINGSLIIADNDQRLILEFQPETHETNVLVRANLGNVSALSFDYLSRNLYWADTERAVIEVLSLQTRHRALIRFFPGQEVPIGLTVMPAEGYLYVVLKAKRHSHIDKIPLSGKGEQVHVFEDDLGDDDIKLVTDYETQTLFWSDSDLGRISYSNYRVPHSQIFRGKLRRPYSLAMVHHDLFWNELGTPRIYWTHKSNMGPRKVIDIMEKGDPAAIMPYVPVATPNGIPLAASSPVGQESHPCQQQNGGCSHICVGEGPYHSICLCPAGFVYRDAGNRTCVEALDCEFRCNSGECLTMNHRCNGRRDCVDNSDEMNCDEEHRRKPKVLCSPSQFACHSGEQCIDKERRCDNRKDCHDRSDEQHCEKFDKNKKCHVHQHGCDNGKCVDSSLVCDGTNDCGDNSDELLCEATSRCEPGMFQCGSGSCIAGSWECDGRIDCSDGSDEHDKCVHRSCPPDMLRCLLGQCLDRSLVCDGHNDCGDKSDELNCGTDSSTVNISCAEDQFQCTSNLKICLPSAVRCNGTTECPRGEDEADCGDVCSIYEFKCRSGRECIRREFRCDGQKDCGDGSDELSCELEKGNHNQSQIQPWSTSSLACRPHLFDCQDGECVDLSRVCNNFPDCTNGHDEGPKCATACRSASGRQVCQHKCRATPSGAVCSCFDGYRLDADQKSCLDIDECQEQQPCAQLCENTLGGYQCQCHADFMLRQDRVSCKSLQSGATLLFSSFNEVRNLSEQPVMLNVAWSANDSRITGFDLDMHRQMGYFSVEDEGIVYQIDLQTKVIVRALGLPAPTKLSVDWATGNVYVLSGAQDIHACSFVGRMCGRIAHVKSPRHVKHLAVDGYHARIFYIVIRTEGYGQTSSEIHMARLDGSRRDMLVQRSESFMTALTTDPHQQLLYFVDQHTRTLERISYRLKTGPMRRPEIMLQKSNALMHPSGLSVYENNAFIVNLGSVEAVQCALYGSRICHKISLNVLNAQDIVVAGRSRQPEKASHPCAHAHCHGLCLQADYGYECMCGNRLVAEGERCPHGSGNEVAVLGAVNSLELEQEQEQNGHFHWLMALLVLAAGSLIAGLGYMYYQYRQRGHTDLNINMHFQNPLATLGGTKAFLDHERTEAGVGFATETGTVSSRGSNDTFTTTSASSSFAAQQFSVPNALQRLLRPRQSASGDPMAQELLLESPRESKLHSLDGGGDGCGVGRQVPDILVADMDDDAAKSAGQFGGNYAGDDANARFVS